MLKPEFIQNKAGGGAPAPAICPRCGDAHAVAEAGTPARYVVRCPTCGTFAWDSVACKAMPYQAEGDRPCP